MCGKGDYHKVVTNPMKQFITTRGVIENSTSLRTRYPTNNILQTGFIKRPDQVPDGLKEFYLKRPPLNKQKYPAVTF